MEYSVERMKTMQDNHGEENHHDAKHSTVDSRRRLINFRILVSQSVSAVLRQSV